MTIDEIINDVNMALTMSGALPKILPDPEIERIIENDAMPWFWENYDDSLIMEYLYVPYNSFKTDTYTNYKYVQLPCNIQNVVWVYKTNDRSMFELGVSAPNLSMHIGITNQPYMNSFLTTIGELGVYKVVIDSFADTLDQLSKDTLKYDFNHASKQLHILTSMGNNLYQDKLSSIVCEVYSHIPLNDLYDLDHFRRYVRAKSGMQTGRLLKRYKFNLPGGVQIDGEGMYSDYEKEMSDLMEEINKKKNGGSSWFWMVNR